MTLRADVGVTIGTLDLRVALDVDDDGLETLGRVLLGDARAHEAEHWHALALAARHAVARLHRAFGKVDAAAINARGRASLEPPLRQFEFLEACT